jgi:hypothetical protein
MTKAQPAIFLRVMTMKGFLNSGSLRLFFFLTALHPSNYNKLDVSDICKLGSKCPDFIRWQDAIRFKSGAYTSVREYFKPDRNTAIG